MYCADKSSGFLFILLLNVVFCILIFFSGMCSSSFGFFRCLPSYFHAFSCQSNPRQTLMHLMQISALFCYTCFPVPFLLSPKYYEYNHLLALLPHLCSTTAMLSKCSDELRYYCYLFFTLLLREGTSTS